jgi:hypothetical protein
MSNSNDRRELLKLKQGLVSKEDSSLELEKTDIIKPTGKKAVENFFYHHKLEIMFVSFFVVVIAFFVYFTFTEEKGDIRVLLISDNEEASQFFHHEAATLKRALSYFTEDFNGDGKHIAQCLHIDLITQIGEIPRNSDSVYGERIKLFGEVKTGDAVIYIGNKEALESIPENAEISIKDFYENFTAPFQIKGSILEEIVEFEKVPVPDDLYLMLRKIENDSKDKALIVFDNIQNNIVMTAD